LKTLLSYWRRKIIDTLAACTIVSKHCFVLGSVTSNQIERLWSRFTSLDKQQKGYLTREDFLRIPELAINPLGDRIVHAFFNDGKQRKT
jgi:Ca2+-binding EF-hand superfamily protein